MLRDELLAWSAGLAGPDLACAVAALGCLQRLVHSPEDLGAALQAMLRLRPQWALFPDVLRTGLPPAQALADLWRRVVPNVAQPRPLHPAIGVQLECPFWLPEIPDDESLAWLNQLLAGAEGVSSVTWLTALEATPNRWSWPLDIGFFDDPGSKALNDDLQQSMFAEFRRHVRVDDVSGPLDLLLVPGDLEQARALPRTPPGLTTNVAVLLGGAGSSDAGMLDLELLRRRFGAEACVLLRLADDERRLWFGELLASLTRDTPLEVALFEVMPRDRPPILVGRRGALRGARLSQQTFRAARRIVDAVARAQSLGLASLFVGLPQDPLSDRLFPAPFPVATPDILRDVRRRIGAFEYADGSDEARTLPGLIASADDLDRSSGPEPRFLRAEIHDETGEPRSGHALTAEAVYFAEVSIGPPETGAMIADRRFEDDAALELRIHWVELSPDPERPFPAPQSASLLLPSSGASQAVRFRFVPARVDEYAARIVVTHRARVLQTALLRAPIAGAARPAEGHSLTVESLLRTFEAASMSGRGFDASLLVNETPAGQPLVTTIHGADVLPLPLGADVERLCNDIGAALDHHADAQDHGDLFDEEARSLFVSLAAKGVLLRRSLLEVGVDDGFAKARRIQLISLRPDAVLPIEICYDGPAPTGEARVCEFSKESLRDGQCSKQCKQPAAERICPLAFWGLSKSIERHVSVPAARPHLAGSEYGALRSEEIDRRTELRLGDGLLWAVSSKVEQGGRGTTATATRGLKRTFGNDAVRARTWDEWKQAVRVHHPGMLALMAHTDLTATRDTVLEIERQQRVLLAQIDRQYVRGPRETLTLAVLLGCSTASPDIGPFKVISSFRQGGAAIVIGTIGPVIGRHSLPTAVALLAEFQRVRAGAQRRTLGEVLVDVRRDLVAAGKTMGLAILAFGDADWRL